MSIRRQRQWQRAYERAALEAPMMLQLWGYSTPDARTWVVSMRGECGTETLAVRRTSHESAEHGRQLCEHAWCEWVADQMFPGRDLETEAHWPIQGPPEPEPAHTIHHRPAARRNTRRTKVVA